MGGECNYLLRIKSDYHLEFVPEQLWKTQDMQEWAEGDILKLLDEAQIALLSAADRLGLSVQLIRKPRAIGVVPTEPTIYEVIVIYFTEAWRSS
jgi:IMP and pyridine-specific 5'-nucleotidase